MSDIPVTLALGSAQFGLAYGVAGRGEPVPEQETHELLAAAWDGGIRIIDTAPVYGDIEQRLLELVGSNAFGFVSKIPALPQGAAVRDIARLVVEAIHRSRERLGANLRTLLFHRGEDLGEAHGELAWRTASDALAGSGVNLGGSFYSPAAAAAARARFPLDVVQLPGNALDQRLASQLSSTALAGVEVHLRSVFLQGLLLGDPQIARSRVPKAVTRLQAWRDWCVQRDLAPLDAALGVARALPQVRSCLIGVDRMAQLREILAAWQVARPLSAPALACDDEDIIDPRRWKAA